MAGSMHSCRLLMSGFLNYQGPKNSNSNIFSRKFNNIFPKKLKKPENVENLFALYHKSMYVSDFTQKPQNIMLIVNAIKTQGICENSMRNQGFFENSRPK